MGTHIKDISLSFVCHENWSTFLGKGATRFCNQCQKTVVDFTGATQQELQKEMTSSKPICGRFRYRQMNPDFVRRAAAVALLSSAMSACQPEAMEPITQPNLETPQILLEEEIILMGEVDFMVLPSDTVMIPSIPEL